MLEHKPFFYDLAQPPSARLRDAVRLGECALSDFGCVDECAVSAYDACQRYLADFLSAPPLVGDADANPTDELSFPIQMLRASGHSLDLTSPKLGSFCPHGFAARLDRAVRPRGGLKRRPKCSEHGAGRTDKADLRKVGQDHVLAARMRLSFRLCGRPQGSGDVCASRC